ncbi:uncharacterized protein LOC120897312 [Anopheles arabiensis]|uniref:uncharacterized protein LOC120897312 n=1 Tax=Anopheles arabiensis TaxID=7173 RepID=UPI001AAD95BE|nr:uncharacterized protein LOC120897312 [Anopheles arabiensis]
MWGQIIGTAFALVGLIVAFVQLNSQRNPKHRAVRDAPRRRTGNGVDSDDPLCEVCEIPQMGDETTWRRFDCGHCYHAKCLSLFASQSCFTCEHMASLQAPSADRPGNS